MPKFVDFRVGGFWIYYTSTYMQTMARSLEE